MNKYIFLIILILFSCESLFHEDNKYIVLDNEQEKVNIINGIYSLLIKVHNHEYFSLLSRSDDINMYDISFYNFRDSDGDYCDNSNRSYSFSEVSGTLYRNLYTAIISANKLINQPTYEEDRFLLGEVYFLRSYCYFKLARFFGTPPIVIDTDVNYQLEKPSYADLYELIESDMLMALELLPESYNDSRIPGETPHKGTAKAMLAEIYLAMAGYPVNNEEKYAEAARYSGEVIEQANDYKYSLLDDLAKLWSVKHRHNTENIFGLFYKITNGEDGNTISANPYIFQDENWLVILTKYKPELMFYNSFPDNYRKYTSLITGTYNLYGYDEIDSSTSGLHYEKLNPLLNPCEYLDYVASIKYIDLNYIHSVYTFYTPSEVTLYLLRYAQTLLTYAESKARIGEIDESAYEAVNKVRRRANKLNINAPSDFDLTKNLTSEQFLDSVVWERAWELCQEPDGRWFDIIRLDLKDKLKDYRYSYEAISTIPTTILNSDWYFYLIPQEDRWLNPNFEEED